MARLTRRGFLRVTGLAASAAVAGCAPAPAPTAPPEEPTAAPVVVELTPTTAPVEEVPSKYKEAPEMADRVARGELPPVDERLPRDPMVVQPIEEIGQYGGTWRQLHIGPADNAQNMYLMHEPIAKYTLDFTALVPNLVRGWEFSEDATSVTLHLREGMKWSDGAPFTADDFMFWYEDIVLNDELTPTKPTQMKRGGELGAMEKVDDYTIRISFTQPYGAFEEFFTFPAWWTQQYQPAHYLKRFHKAYASEEELQAAMAEEGFDTWTDLFGAKIASFNNPGTPTVMPWVVENSVESPVQTYSRNPYYWKVDPEGNQLPYISGVSRTLVPDSEALLLKAIAGDADYQARRVAGLANYPVVMENREKGDYRVVSNLSPQTNIGTIMFNYSHKDPILKELFLQRDFRVALSLAIDRAEINDLLYKGQGTPGQASVAPGSPWFEEEHMQKYAEYDPDRANELLDGLGLTERDAEGFRLRPDGKRLTLVNLTFTPWGENVAIQEMVKEYWKAIGVEVLPKPTEVQLWVTQVHGLDFDIASYGVNFGFHGNPPIVRETFCIAESGQHWAPQWGLWYQTDGKEGEEPPEEVKQLQGLYEHILAEPSIERRIELSKQGLQLHADNLWMIGILADAPVGSFTVVKNNFRNVPEVPYDATTVHVSQFFFRS
ncbi:MAG: ABC transporter substrate-binding protein [Anaerolineae bacterium]|nr:ABC transporter substrate-binding protein [Anaerolineae bacterium]